MCVVGNIAWRSSAANMSNKSLVHIIMKEPLSEEKRGMKSSTYMLPEWHRSSALSIKMLWPRGLQQRHPCFNDLRIYVQETRDPTKGKKPSCTKTDVIPSFRERSRNQGRRNSPRQIEDVQAGSLGTPREQPAVS